MNSLRKGSMSEKEDLKRKAEKSQGDQVVPEKQKPYMERVILISS